MAREQIDPLDAELDQLFGAPGSGDQEVAPVDQTHPDSRLWVWDIETGPLSNPAIKKFFSPPEAPGEFDPDSVKVGNLGPEKAEAKVEAKRQEHLALEDRYDAEVKKAYEAFVERCPLNPVTGRVITSQYLFLDANDEVHIDESGWGADTMTAEARLLMDLWDRVETTRRANGRIIGFGIAGFDLPFSIQRSFRLGIPVPKGLFWKNRYPVDVFIDLYDVWRCGRTSKFTDAVGFKLNEVCEFLGLQTKTLADGGEFWQLYKSTKTRAKAIDYARNDVQMIGSLARRLGVVN